MSPIQRLYDRFQAELDAAGGRPLDSETLEKVAGSTEGQEVRALDAASVDRQLDELRKKVGPAVIESLRSTLTPDQQAKVGVGDYGAPSPQGIGRSAKEPATFDPTLRTRIEKLFDTKEAAGPDRVEKVLKADPRLVDDLRDALKAQRDEVHSFVDARREAAAMNAEDRVNKLAELDGYIAHQAEQVKKSKARLDAAPEDKREAATQSYQRTAAKLETLQQQRAALAQLHEKAQDGTLEATLNAFGDTRDYDWMLEKLSGGTIDPALEALIAHYAGLGEKFRATMDREGRHEEVTQAIASLPPFLRERLSTPRGAQEFGEKLAAALELEDPAATVRALEALRDGAPKEYKGQLEQLIGVARERVPSENQTKSGGPKYGEHGPERSLLQEGIWRTEARMSLADEKGYEFLMSLASSEDEARRVGKKLGWEEADIDRLIDHGHQILDGQVPALKHGEFYTLRELFTQSRLEADAKVHKASLEGSVNPTEYRELQLKQTGRALASSLFTSKIDERQFRKAYGGRHEAIQTEYRHGRSMLHLAKNAGRVSLGMRSKAPLTPQQLAVMEKHPDFRSAYQDYQRSIDSYDAANANTLREIQSLLRSGLPIDRLMVAVMLLLTQREEEKFKRTLAETGVIEQVERINDGIRERQNLVRKERARRESDEADSTDPYLTPEDYEKFKDEKMIEPTEFGLSPKSHHIMTQELQASLQFFQQMMQTMSQVLQVWQGLVDSILSRWR